MNSLQSAGSKGCIRSSHHNSRLVPSTCIRPNTYQRFLCRSTPQHTRLSSVCRAATQDPRGSLDGDDSTESGDGMSSEDMAAFATRMNAMVASKPVMTGKQLRQLVFKKWGKTYDVRLQKIGGKMYLQVMWKFLEQKSFPLSEVEYMQQLDAVAEYLTAWGVIETTNRVTLGDHWQQVTVNENEAATTLVQAPISIKLTKHCVCACHRVTSGIQSGYARGPGYNHGGGAQCISVPLNVDLSGEFGADWR